MRIRSTIIAAAALMLAVPATGTAQVSLGPQLSWGGDTDIGIGGRVLVGVESLPRWDFIGTFDVFFPDDGPNNDVSYWEANGNLAYNFVIEDAESIFPYVGGGLNIGRVSNEFDDGSDVSNTDLGINLLGGTQFEAASVIPFVEIRLLIEGAPDGQVVLTGGVLF